MKSCLYTGTGDDGTTSLVGGERISKVCARLEAYGTVDEFSSFLGVVLSNPGCPSDLKETLLEIQNRLFDAGCYLATSVKDGESPCCAGINEESICKLEGWIDLLDSETPKIRAFVLPGGCEQAAHCHVARTVCRRAERRILELAINEYVDPLLIKWFNRLSDYLFIAARYLNHVNGVAELTWKSAYK
ncbi:MAG: cob(I)yrinic acid a,c-diamide adenosyltransferase [Muribaculaceae bacterium]|nr:cob(I)yrinic acid a,c-diamide adenosyltransferase [Muribaculaceae bacterium]MDE7097105.1 cob(I)yrinic acid a,c-diamide adenosyltransferase [Muribaculaceae bacterium]